MFVLRGLLLIIAAVLSSTSQVHAEVLDWATRPSTNLLSGAIDTTSLGGISITTSGVGSGSAASRTLDIRAGTYATHTGIVYSQIDANTDNGSVSNTVTLNFSVPVYNLSFTIGDIDGTGTSGNFRDVVSISSNAGFPIATSVGSNVNYDGTSGVATTRGNAVSDSTGDLTLQFPGPVSTVTIAHSAGNVSGSSNPANQVVTIDDLVFFPSP